MATRGAAADYPYFDNGGRPLALAHRGGSPPGGEGLENTVQAFETAVGMGFRYLETDVHATRDGVLVAFHDETLERTTDGRGRVEDLDFAVLARLRTRGRQPVARFADVLATWPDVRFNIDAKSDAAVPLLARVVGEARAWDRVLVASFSAARVHRMRALLGPRVASAYSVPGVAALRLLPGRVFRRAVLGGREHRAQAAQVPTNRGSFEVVTTEFVDRAHELGSQVHVWTVDEPSEMHRLLDLGVDGLISDRIDLLRDAFTVRGLWDETRHGG